MYCGVHFYKVCHIHDNWYVIVSHWRQYMVETAVPVLQKYSLIAKYYYVYWFEHNKWIGVMYVYQRE